MSDERPNILFLLSDEHSFRCMGRCAEEDGGEPICTPNFDWLAERGAVFTDAYCQMPLCTPSRISLLTGREVRASGAWTNRSVLRPELPTLPGALAAAGYETCLVGKMHLGGNVQYAGFRHRPYGDLTGGTGHQWEPLGSEERTGMRVRTEKAGVTEIPESLIQDQVVCHESVAWLREFHSARPDRPWFLCASFSRPHFPYTSPARHFNRYWPGNITPPRVGPTGDAYDHPMSVNMRKGFEADAISDEEMMKARAAYFACVSYLDEAIGDLLLRLESAGLLENTIVVYASDHGEMAGEHGVWWKNGWYEACTRVPLIVSTPEQREGDDSARTIRTPVGLVDLFPTLCAFAEAETPDELDGEDLSAVVCGEAEAPDRPIFCDALTTRWGKGNEFRMARWGRFKYVGFRSAPPLFFDLEEDPGEQRNLVDCAEGEARDALDRMRGLVGKTMDFDAAEWERDVRDGELKEKYSQGLGRRWGNLYVMPSGKVADADAPLYSPTTLSDNPAEFFHDWPGSADAGTPAQDIGDSNERGD